MLKARYIALQIVTVDSEGGVCPSETFHTMCEATYLWQFCRYTQTNGDNSQMYE